MLDFTESFTELLVQQGLPRMEARVLACLYITDSGTLTAADLVQRLRVSPASISHAIAFLEQQGMLRRERVPGARRERYVVDDEIWLPNLLAALRMNEALAAASRRGAEILGVTTAGGRPLRDLRRTPPPPERGLPAGHRAVAAETGPPGRTRGRARRAQVRTAGRLRFI
ncbi:GbsR/MarR family transcriptional regulator [Nonomuraea ferruginea]